MFFALLTLFTALGIAGVAAWFSIAGLMSIFSAEALAIAIMAGLLELGKLVSASWLYRNWRTSGWMLKTYLCIAVLVLMLITSMGIFGYLSRAHLANQSQGQEITLQLQRIDAKIAREQAKIQDAETVIAQLDRAVQVLQDNARIRGPDGAIAVRRSQQAERSELNSEISQAAQVVEKLQDDRLVLSQKNITVEQELGPLKYVSELVYQDQSQENLDRTVRIFILMLVFVFDPLAIMLLIAANNTLLRLGVVLEREPELKPPPETTTPEPQEETEPDSESCPKCGTSLILAPGIGDFCPNPECDVMDGPFATPVTVEPEPSVAPEPLVAEPDSIHQDFTDEIPEEVNNDERTESVEPEVRKIVEELVQEEQPDISQLQQVAKHLAQSKANKNNMTEEEIVEVLASSTKSEAKTKLGFWAVPLPNRDQ